MELNEEVVKTVKVTDWYYDKLSGSLKQYLDAARTYRVTVNMLAKLPYEVITDLVTKYAPTDMHYRVYKDIDVAKERGFYV